MSAPRRRRPTCTSAAAATAVLAASTLLSLPSPAMADAPPRPEPIKWYIDGDGGGRTGGALMKQRKQKRFLEVVMRGNAEYSWYETLSGHTVQISEVDGEPHYLDVDDEMDEHERRCVVQ